MSERKVIRWLAAFCVLLALICVVLALAWSRATAQARCLADAAEIGISPPDNCKRGSL